MVEVNPPLYAQDGCYTAAQDRGLLASLVCTEGVQGTGDLAVTTANSGLTVNIASGQAFILGDASGSSGMYHVENDGTVAATLVAADPTDARIDSIFAVVKDQQYAGSVDEWELAVVTGTPSPSPVAPTTPAAGYVGFIKLAEVSIPAGDTLIQSSQITDSRTVAQLCDSMVPPAGLIAIQTFTSSGSFTKASYPTGRAVRVRLVGGGGGGGAAPATTHTSGSGGGGGGYCEEYINFTSLAASETVTVGAGGSAGGTSGGTGGSSSFGSHCTANGGAGGGQRTSDGGQGVAGGVGGTATGGNINLAGQSGAYAYGNSSAVSASITAGGDGGDSQLGRGGRGPVLVAGGGAVGVNGNSYGGGGSGAANDGGGANAGGAGAQGIVIVEVYS